MKEYHKKHKEKHLVLFKKYYEENKEKILKQKKEYHIKNRGTDIIKYILFC